MSVRTLERESAAGDRKGGATPEAETGAVLLKDRYQIWPDARLPQLDSPAATACAAIDTANGNEGLFALACDGRLPPRDDVLGALRDLRAAAMIRMVESGHVWWPRDERRRLVIVCERPAGGRAVRDYDTPAPPLGETDAIRGLLAPAISALAQLAVFNVVHRAIRPTNLFFADATKRSLMLGECVTAPPAFDQPALFESVDMAMAAPAGRGPGTPAHDVYALGVTLLYLLLGRHPAPGLDDAALLAAKLASGSFNALVARNPIPTGLREPLRGMLQDDPAQRWTLADLEGWVTERRLKPFQTVHSERANRPFALDGQNHYTCRALARTATQNWRSDGLGERKTELAQWVERSVGDGHRREAIEQAYDQRASATGIGGDSTARAMLNARIALALDPHAPLRYKDVTTMIDGMGPLLAANFADAGFVQQFVEIVRSGLPAFWIDLQHRNDKGAVALLGQFRRLNNFLRDPRPGFGPERCLYDLNPGQHCLSPLVEREGVVRIEDLLPALERIARNMSEGQPFDRHIAAFVAARADIDVAKALAMLHNRGNPAEAAVGLLSLYTTLQWRFGPAKLPALTRWIMAGAEPLIATYHHRTARKRAEAELPRILEDGSIVGLYNFLLNGELRRQDDAGFAEAVAAFARAESEIAFLESGGASNPRRAREFGQRIAAGLATALAAVAIALATVAGT